MKIVWAVLFPVSLLAVPLLVNAAVHSAGTNILNNGTIYMVTADGQLRPYTSAGAYLSYGFNSWGNVVQANSDDLALATGAFIPPRDGTIMCSDRGSDKGTCYLITNGQKAGFTSENVFNQSGFNFKYALYGDVSFLPTAPNISSSTQAHLPGTLINDSGTIKLVGTNGTIGVPSMDTLQSWGYSLVNVVNANSADQALPQNAILTAHVAGQLAWNNNANNPVSPTPTLTPTLANPSSTPTPTPTSILPPQPTPTAPIQPTPLTAPTQIPQPTPTPAPISQSAPSCTLTATISLLDAPTGAGQFDGANVNLSWTFQNMPYLSQTPGTLDSFGIQNGVLIDTGTMGHLQQLSPGVTSASSGFEPIYELSFSNAAASVHCYTFFPDYWNNSCHLPSVGDTSSSIEPDDYHAFNLPNNTSSANSSGSPAPTLSACPAFNPASIGVNTTLSSSAPPNQTISAKNLFDNSVPPNPGPPTPIATYNIAPSSPLPNGVGPLIVQELDFTINSTAPNIISSITVGGNTISNINNGNFVAMGLSSGCGTFSGCDIPVSANFSTSTISTSVQLTLTSVKYLISYQTNGQQTGYAGRQSVSVPSNTLTITSWTPVVTCTIEGESGEVCTSN